MPVIRAVFFSFWFHFLLITALVWLAPRLTPQPPEVIEISLDPEAQILDALTPQKNQIVRQTLVPENLKAPDDESLARLLSEKKQRVIQEMQAAASGMTANRQQQAPPTERTRPTNPAEPSPSKTNEIETDENGYRRIDISKQLQQLNQLSEGMSTVGESLPTDIKVGSFTALNTDRYLFYTFYARMEELVRYRWETRVQQAINMLDRPTLSLIGGRNWVTHVEFLLDKNGYLKKAIIMKESGIPPFDAAAVNAFLDARVFPNPPQEMIQEDGLIHIKFGFTVNYNPPSLVNRN